MLLQTGRGLDGLSMRQAFNITHSWLVTRTPEELDASTKVQEAFESEFSMAAGTAVTELSEDTVEALLDSL